MEGVELHLAVAQPDPEDEVSPPDDVQGRHVLGHLHRVMQGKEQDAGDAGHPPCLGGQPRQERDELQLHRTFGEIVMPSCDRIPVPVAGRADHDELLFQGGDHVGPGRVLVGDVDAHFHLASPRGMVPSVRGRVQVEKSPQNCSSVRDVMRGSVATSACSPGVV